MIAATPEPPLDARPQGAVDPRTLAAWHIAHGWRRMAEGDVPAALDLAGRAWVPRAEWDMRFMRDMLLLQLFAMDPEAVTSRYSAPSLVREVQWLVDHRLWEGFLAVRVAPWMVPQAAALVMASPGGCPRMEPLARPLQVVLDGRGAEFLGVLYRGGTAFARLLAHPELKPEGMSPGQRRKTKWEVRSRVAAAFERIGKPGGLPKVVRAEAIMRSLRQLERAARASDDQEEWGAAVRTYGLNHGIEPEAENA